MCKCRGNHLKGNRMFSVWGGGGCILKNTTYFSLDIHKDAQQQRQIEAQFQHVIPIMRLRHGLKVETREKVQMRMKLKHFLHSAHLCNRWKDSAHAVWLINQQQSNMKAFRWWNPLKLSSFTCLDGFGLWRFSVVQVGLSIGLVMATGLLI